MSNIAFIPLLFYTSVLFTLAKITTKAKNLIYFHPVNAGVFFSCAYRSFYNLLDFSTSVSYLPGSLL